MAAELQGASCLVEEEERFHGLPPLKRFKILEKERVMQKRDGDVGVEREDVNLQRENEVIKVCNLPAKKRVCALQFFMGLPDEDDEQENRNMFTKKKRESSFVAARALQPIFYNCQVPVSIKPDEKDKEVKKTREASSTGANRPVSVSSEATEKASAREQRQNLAKGANRQLPVTTGIGEQHVKKREIGCVPSQHVYQRQLSVATASCNRIGEREVEVKVARSKKEASLASAVSITPDDRTTACNRQVSVAAVVNCEGGPATTCEERQKETETSCVVDVQPIHDRQVSVATGQAENGVGNKLEEKCPGDEVQGESDGEDDGVFCDVCKGADAEPSDPIVFCDGCNVMVHPSCYGSPLNDGIPAGDWFCRQCESESRRKKAAESKKGSHVGFHVGQRACASRMCCLCPSRKGAMKRTTGGAWAHLSCALYVPEVFYRRARDREGIECGSVPAWRWELPCVVCSTRGKGSCIQCTEVGCSSTFHVSCALNAGLTIDFRNANALTKTPAIVIAFCPSHSRQALTSSERRRFKIVPRGRDTLCTKQGMSCGGLGQAQAISFSISFDGIRAWCD